MLYVNYPLKDRVSFDKWYLSIYSGQLQFSKHGQKFNYLSFAGWTTAEQYVECDSNIDLTSINNFTIISKVKYIKDTVGDGGTIFISGHGSSYFQLRIKYSTNKVSILKSSVAEFGLSNGVINENVWKTIGITYNGTTGAWGIFIDGISDKTGTNLYTFNNINEAQIGRKDGANNEYFKGDIAYVKVYNRILSDTELLEEFNGAYISDGLVNYYDFHEGSGTILADIISGNNGTIVGPTWGEIDTLDEALDDPIFDGYKLFISNGQLGWETDVSKQDEIILVDIVDGTKWRLVFDYGQFSYVDVDSEFSDTPYFKVELRDREFNIVKVLTKYISTLSWEYNRIGGCGNCALSIPKGYKYLDNFINPDYDLQIWLPINGEQKLVYRGYAEIHKPIATIPDVINLSFNGYSGQLKRIRINQTFTNTDINSIVKSIIQTVEADTSIIYEENLIAGQYYFVDELEFDCMADEALETLAQLAGDAEWGVDYNRKFFFLIKDRTIKHYARLRVDTGKLDVINDYSQIVNKLIVKTTEGIEYTVNNTESQNAFGVRTEITSNSSLVTEAVAQQYATNVLKDKASINQRVNVQIISNNKFYEDVIPVGKMVILGTSVAQARKYGDNDAIYGTFYYGGTPSYDINSVKYSLSISGTNVTINLGQARPDVASQIKRLEFELGQVRNA